MFPPANACDPAHKHKRISMPTGYTLFTVQSSLKLREILYRCTVLFLREILYRIWAKYTIDSSLWYEFTIEYSGGKGTERWLKFFIEKEVVNNWTMNACFSHLTKTFPDLPNCVGFYSMFQGHVCHTSKKITGCEVSSLFYYILKNICF